MSNIDEAQAAIALVKALTERAIQICENSPYWHYIGRDEWARIQIDGETCTITTPEVSSDYGGGYNVDTDTYKFPTALLLLSEAEFSAWQKRARARYDQEQKEKNKNAALAREAQERAVFAALKAKYG